MFAFVFLRVLRAFVVQKITTKTQIHQAAQN